MKSENVSAMPSALACVAFQYPLYMAAQFVLSALPALLRAVMLRQRLAYLRVSPFGIAAAVASSNASGGIGAPAASFSALLQTVLLVAVFVALLGLARRRNALLAGLAVATLGFAGLLNPTWQIFIQKNVNSPAVLEFLLFFAIVCLGLRWMQVSAPAENYLARTAGLLACFNVPLLLLGLVFAQALQLRATRFLWVMPPAAIATLLMSALPTAGTKRDASAAGWRTIVAGEIGRAHV